MCTVWRKLLLGISLASLSLVSVAEDIDLFAGVAPSAVEDKANILIVLDNTANWNQAFTNEVAALVAVFNGLEADRFKVGLMMFSETGGDNRNPDGGYIRAATRLMDTANKVLYRDLFVGLDRTDDKSNGGKLALAMAEAYYYFSGEQAYAGHNKAKRDYAGNLSGTKADNAVYALAGNAFDSATATKYKSPVESGCQKNFIIYISNGAVQDNSSDTTRANTQLTALGGNTREIPLSPGGSQSNAADEWARFMAADASTRIVTYTVDVDPVLNGQGPGFTALLKSMAGNGRGKYFSVDSSVDNGIQIMTALNRIFSEIQSVNSVFASAGLPISVNTQSTFLNQVFIGMFRPDASAAPRWHGNLKQYQFKVGISGEGLSLNLADADDVLAINSNTGFITQCARSFWTPSTDNMDSYWAFNPQGLCTTIANSAQSNTPDGEIVEKGAVGYQLRAMAPSSRTIKTCNPDSCTGLVNFDTTNTAITSTLLKAANDTERTRIINWSRGMDVNDENNNGNFEEMRPSVHGDIVHSRPLAIDYGNSIGVVVFYGANDGMLHAVNGNQSTNIGSYLPGSELWSFIAPEHYGKLKRIYDNSPAITLPSVNDGTAKPYFFDGPVTGHKENETVWIYATQRRGGRMIYALDASTPIDVRLKWRQGCPNLSDDTGCTASEFIQMGQTWSAAKIIKSSGYVSGETPKPMLIMGGGYDLCEDGGADSDLNSCTSPKGNRVFVLDADSGVLLKAFPTNRSVVGDITIVTNVITGLADYAYAADTGGNLYRITMGSAAPESWTMTRIAALGCSTTHCPGGVANRKFLFAPEVVVTPDFNAVLIGSGDREHPLLKHTTTAGVDNAFFMLKDKPTDTNWWSSEAGHCESLALACMASLLEIDPDSTTMPTEAALNAKKGWYLALGAENSLHDKEQVVTTAVVVLGVLSFSTHTPTRQDPESCGSDLGLARVYNLNFLDSSPVGATRSTVITGGGLPPSPVSGMVNVRNPNTGTVIAVPFIIGTHPDSVLEGLSPAPAVTPARSKSRAYWFLQQQ
ncbi:type IV pilus assembly protein PilY1 [Nitrosomonas cryotolerans]|uniref:Type IV pilus assembly protein PilY1 n=1 Tax=Nitrosomonas cryotolerans ATCC 49181 TaxID=1131553 RepID=A0A1N6FJH8_9PROT|nr:PilC/PilY family type IV pilus protein [Nitrosomonas cryotolerans]SFP81955.1 type IV pilus assembly protein PilY1 [Nitrosomonas cryotolerans]SIN95453.1 type IV pilus assembly protein PilY1 [Nitrosomonas cryotolerans ATCC 49181]